METVHEGKGCPDSDFSKRRLGRKYIEKDAGIVVNPVFESAVVQIRKRFEDELTTQQKSEVKCLLKSSVHGCQESEKEGGVALTMMERLAKRRKKEVRNNKCIICDFIL